MARWDFTPTPEELAEVERRLGGDLDIPYNFEQVPPHPSSSCPLLSRPPLSSCPPLLSFSALLIPFSHILLSFSPTLLSFSLVLLSFSLILLSSH